jgi:hypothetical protein
MRNLRPLLALISLTISMALTGCFKPDEQPRAGVDDFPNSIHAQVVGFLDESKKSDQISAIPSVTDSLLGVQGFYGAPVKNVVAKISAAPKMSTNLFPAPLLTVPVHCDGRFKFDTTLTTPTKITVNHVELCIDTSKSNGSMIKATSISTYLTGRVEKTEITDADGDGVINPVLNSIAKARMVITITDAGIVEQTVLVVGPGPDNNFDTEADNLIYVANWAKTNNAGKDTLGSATYSDADQSGSVIDNGKPSMVDLDLYTFGPTSDHPDAVWSRAQMRMIVRYGIKDNEATRVHFEMLSTDGRRSTADLLNLNGGPDFIMSDKIKAHFLTTGTAPTDTIDTLEIFLTMKVGGNLEDKSDDSIMAIDVRTQKKIGEEKTGHFSFISDFPIPSGKDPQTGTVSMQIEYTDASRVELDGKLLNKELDVKVLTRDGKRLHVVWDALGRGKTMEEIP